jgi:hypothetical protein
MQTTDLMLATEWVLISDGSHTCIFDVKSAGVVFVHLNETTDAPESDAPCVEVQSWPAAFDFSITGMSGNQRIWARAKIGAVPIVIIK